MTDAVETPVEVVAEVPVKVKKTDLTKTRRDEMLSKVTTFFAGNTEKSYAHTMVFKELFPDLPKSTEACEKWRDVGVALMTLLNTGEITSDRPDGKARVVFTSKKEVVEVPESTNTEGEGI